MKPPFTITGKINKGKLDLHRDRFRQALADLGDCEVVITVKPLPKQGRDYYREWYFAAVVATLQEQMLLQGVKYNEQQAHDHIKSEILPVDVKSTSELSDQEFYDFIVQARLWAMDVLEVFIPEPRHG